MAATIDDLLAEMRLVRKGQDSENVEASEQAQRERALLGQSEKQYEATLAQRKATEASQKELQDLESILGGDAKNNKQYQKAEAKLEKEKMKLTKLENRRNLLKRFKDDPKGVIKDAGAAGAKVVKSTGKVFGKLLGFLKKFGGLFAVLVLPALLLLVNSPVWEILKQKVKDLIEWFGKPDNPIVNFFNDIIKGNFLKAFDDAITRAIKAAFGVEFEGSVGSVIKRFIGDFLAGLANLLPDFDVFKEAKAALNQAAANLDPIRKAAMEAQKKREEETETLLQSLGLGQKVKLTDAVNNPEDNIFFNKNGGPQVDISAAARAAEKIDDALGKPFSDYFDGIATGFRKQTGNMLTLQSASDKQLADRLRELSEMEEDRFNKEKVLVGSTAAQRIQMSQLEGMPKDEMIKILSDELKLRSKTSIIPDKSGAFKPAVTVDIKELMSKVGKNTDELRRQREALAEAKRKTANGQAAVAIDGSTTVNTTSPTNQAISSPRQIKQDGTAGAIARGVGSMVGGAAGL